MSDSERPIKNSSELWFNIMESSKLTVEFKPPAANAQLLLWKELRINLADDSNSSAITANALLKSNELFRQVTLL